MPGRVGKGRRYRSPARRRYLERVVDRALDSGWQPPQKILDELSAAFEYSGRRKSQISSLLHKSRRIPPRVSRRSRNDRKPTDQISGADFGLRLVIPFDRDDGKSLQYAIREVEAKLRGMPKGTRVESVLSSLPKNKRWRLSWAVEILQVLNDLGVEPEKVRAVHISEKEDGGYVIVGVKLSGMTFRGEFGE